jgi:hypothetical protein
VAADRAAGGRTGRLVEGVMDDLTRIWVNLGSRIGGPLSFRLLLQPLVAATLAIRAGRARAHGGGWRARRNEPYLMRRGHGRACASVDGPCDGSNFNLR